MAKQQTNTKATPRDFFLHLLSIFTLYLSVIGVLTIIFQLINLYLPDALDTLGYYRAEQAREMMRLGIAFLVVCFPVFAWTVFRLKKLILQDSKLQQLRVRHWLMYFTIFLSLVVIIITLITLLMSFLNGEVTLRFVLKVASVLVVALLVLTHYHTELKRGSKAIAKSIMIGSIVLILASIITAFFNLGSPQEARERRFDEERVSDLQSISYTVEGYVQQKKELPGSLKDVYQSTLPSDPLTKEPYAYTVQSETSYTLCTTFNHPSEQEEFPIARPFVDEFTGTKQVDWSHDAGDHCFTIDVIIAED